MIHASLYPSLQKNLIEDEFGFKGFFFLHAYMRGSYEQEKDEAAWHPDCFAFSFLIFGGRGGHIQAFTGLIKVVIKTRKLKCDVSMKNRQHVSLNIELFLTHVKEKR